MDYNKPTDELESSIENLKPDEMDIFFSENKKYLPDDKKAFCYYMRDIIAEKGIKKKDIYSFADLSEHYGEQLISMDKHTKNRDTILRLCIAAHFSVLEINRALKLYGMTPLYVKDKRDACLIVAINNRVYSFADLNEILLKSGFAPLEKENT